MASNLIPVGVTFGVPANTPRHQQTRKQQFEKTGVVPTTSDLSLYFRDLCNTLKVSEELLDVKIFFWLQEMKVHHSDSMRQMVVPDIKKELLSPNLSWGRFLDGLAILGIQGFSMKFD